MGVTRYTDPAAVTDVIREPTGQLAALRRTGSGTRYPITNALGSVIAFTDPAGTKIDTFSYDPYGADTGRTGTTENPYRFAGEHRDYTGLYKIGQRYCTPELGRWTQPDPLRRSVNPLNPPDASPYIYTGNNHLHRPHGSLHLPEELAPGRHTFGNCCLSLLTGVPNADDRAGGRQCV
jgi:RHS repeat-associated protein